MFPTVLKEFVIHDKTGTKELYVRLKKALYGTLTASLLYYQKWRRDIESIGYKVNVYNPCVANKKINGSLHTIRWHVDDVMGSHVSSKVNDNFISWLKRMYENDIGEVKVTRGNVHDYLAIEFEFDKKNGKVCLRMLKYIKKLIDEFPYQDELSKKHSSVPAAEHLFNTNPKGIKLGKVKREVFHSVVAQALFVCFRSRPDIMLTVMFLTTRVKSPDTDDWKKLLKLLSYLNGTRGMYLTLSMNGSVMNWFADASFGVHPDFKSHTGGALVMGTGSIINKSMKQKLNTHSSTEAELVAADDMSSIMLWSRLFMKEQGYDVELVLHQDNKSAKLLLDNGRRSLGKRTRHLNIRYYFLHDQIMQGILKAQYCSTENMIANFFTKPLQGCQFRELRKLILGIKEEVK